MVWYGVVGMVWYGMVWYGMVWYGMVWYGTVRYGTVRYGTVRYGTVRYGTVRYGTVWYGMVCMHVDRILNKIYFVVDMKTSISCKNYNWQYLQLIYTLHTRFIACIHVYLYIDYYSWRYRVGKTVPIHHPWESQTRQCNDQVMDANVL